MWSQLTGLAIDSPLNKDDPVRFIVLSSALPDSRFLVGEGDDLANWYLGFIPLEDQNAVAAAREMLR